MAMKQALLQAYDPWWWWFSCSVMECSFSGFSVHGISQAEVLEWVAISSPGDLPHPGIKHGSSALQADSSPTDLPGKPSEDP